MVWRGGERDQRTSALSAQNSLDLTDRSQVYTHQRGRELAPQERAILWSSDGVARSGDVCYTLSGRGWFDL